MTWEELEQLRDDLYWRTPQKQVTSIEEAEEFVNAVGFCFAFTAKNSELPCLWHAAAGERDPVYPHHTHHDPYISLVWQAKDDLAHAKKIYYGKAIKTRPSMISLEYFPYFYRLSRSTQEADAYLADYMSGNMSADAKRIMDSLTENSPQITSDLKISSGLSSPKSRANFDKAMAELQMKMYVAKIAEFYDPFTFLWDLVDHRFAVEIKKASGLDRPTCIRFILKKYFSVVLAAKEIEVLRLFRWPETEIREVLEVLTDENYLADDLVLEDRRGRYFALSSII